VRTLVIRIDPVLFQATYSARLPTWLYFFFNVYFVIFTCIGEYQLCFGGFSFISSSLSGCLG